MRDPIGPLVIELARTRAAISPAPRGLPYWGLEPISSTTLDLIANVVAHGVFRKYEQVLDVEGGLGAVARWAAVRRGCEAVVTTRSAAEAAAGALLTERAHLTWQVRHVAADPTALPMRTAACTHAWIVEALPRVTDPDSVLAEVFRTVRPGGLIGVQDLVGSGDDVVPGWRVAPLATRLATIRAAGFVDIQSRDVTAEATERASVVVGAREALQERLLGSDDHGLRAMAAERTAVAAALDDGRLRVVQALARRP